MTALHADPPPTEPGLLQKEAALGTWLRDAESVLVGFSGGVDSAFLAVFAQEVLGASRVLAVIGRSPSYPDAQWKVARDVAASFALTVHELETHELSDPHYAANPTNRCYFCKSELWSHLVPLASERGFRMVIDGTNADDQQDFRPGAEAARERGVRSPLAEVGLTKSDIRELSRVRGIPTWQAPSAPCLSSRIPYGTAVTNERLRQIERAEAALRELGVPGDMRVRYHGDLARIEVGALHLPAWLTPENSSRMAAAVRQAGFARVAIDLRGFRSGSLNVLNGHVGER